MVFQKTIQRKGAHGGTSLVTPSSPRTADQLGPCTVVPVVVPYGHPPKDVMKRAWSERDDWTTGRTSVPRVSEHVLFRSQARTMPSPSLSSEHAKSSLIQGPSQRSESSLGSAGR